MKNKFIDFFRKRKYIIIASFFLVLLVLIICMNFFKTDGMQNGGVLKLKYKVYTQEKGWTKWSKNGVSSGTGTNNIKNIKFQIKNDYDELVVFKVYSNGKWSEYYYINQKIQNNSINGIQFSLLGKLDKKYNICYRTHNKKDKWLNWTCSNEISGNKNINIDSIEIKIIPKNVILNEYLKDYSLRKNPYINF